MVRAGRGFRARRPLSGGAPTSRLAAAAAAGGPKTSSGKSWLSYLPGDPAEKSDCRSVYNVYMKLVKPLGEEHPRYAEKMKELEDWCGEYKSLWSSWWTEKDSKNLCEEWSEFYHRKCVAREGLKAYCSEVMQQVRNACKGVREASSL